MMVESSYKEEMEKFYTDLCTARESVGCGFFRQMNCNFLEIFEIFFFKKIKF